MKFSTTKKNILGMISNAERFTGKQITLPTLQSVLFEIMDNVCLIKATNLEIGLEASFSCKTDRDGIAAISPKLLFGILQHIQEESITLELKQGIIFIETETSHTKLNTISSDDFPLIPKIKTTTSFFVSRMSFVSAMEQVLPAVSLSDFKPEISGVYLVASGKSATLAATDTFRLAEKKIFLEKEASGKFSCIIPFKMAQEIVRTLGTAEEVASVEVGIGDNQLMISWNASRMVSRVMDGNFPEYKAIIPKDFGITFSIPRDAILRRVRMANVLTGKLNDVVLKTGKNEISILSVNPELGTTSSSFSTPVKGKEATATLNARYFADGIASCGGENIFVGMNDENSPILLKNPEDDSFCYIVMPIRNTPSY